MSKPEILVYVDQHAGSAARLSYAGAMAAKFGFDIAALFVQEPSHVDELAPMAQAGMIDPNEVRRSSRRAIKSLSKSSGELLDRFETLLNTLGLRGSWSQIASDDKALVRRAMYSDLVVLGTRASEKEAGAPDPAELALNSGRPVVLLPSQPDANVPPIRILCAWNGRRESVRAIVDALPILSRAESVTILTIATNDASDDGASAGGMATYLVRLGIPAKVKSCIGEDSEVASMILDEARRGQCDLIVMGAYGHSRLRESLLGGATRDMLANPQLPLLISH